MSAPASMTFRARSRWPANGGRVVLGAPVREDDDDVGAGRAGGLDVGLDGLERQRRAADLVVGGVVVAGDRVVGEDRDLDAVGLEDGRLAGRGQVLAGAGRRRPRFLRFLIVWRSPARPASRMWLLATPMTSNAGVREAVDERRVGREDRAPTCASGSGSAPGSRSWRSRCRRPRSGRGSRPRSRSARASAAPSRTTSSSTGW